MPVATLWRRVLVAVLALTPLTLSPFVSAPTGAAPSVQHVLLISVDGLHQSDVDWYVRTHPNSALASLVAPGVDFTNAQTPVPSDSFPGMVAQATGGDPWTTGIYYDDTYNHALLPAGTTNCAGATPGVEVTYFEQLDKDQSALDAGQGLSGLPDLILNMTGNPDDLNAAWRAAGNSGDLVAFSVDDDGVLMWLNDRSQTAADFAKNFLLGYNGTGDTTDGKAKATNIHGKPKAYTAAGLATVYAADAATYFHIPAGDSAGMSRVPDLVGIAQVGTVYTGGTKKIAEHGGANPQDRDVPIIVSGGGITAGVNNTPVETTQIAPTILQLLGLNPSSLQAVQQEHTAVLPLTASSGGATGEFTVSFTSAQPGQGMVYFGSGPGCSGLVGVATGDQGAGTTSHTVTVRGNDLPGSVGAYAITPGTTYWYETVTVTAGGQEVDNNHGLCYQAVG